MLARIRRAVRCRKAELKDQVSLGGVIDQLITSLILECGIELVVAAVGSVTEGAGKEASIGPGIGNKDAGGGQDSRRDGCRGRWCGLLG